MFVVDMDQAFRRQLPASIFELTLGWNDIAEVDSETTQSDLDVRASRTFTPRPYGSKMGS